MLRKAFEFIVFTNIWISLGAGFMVWETYLLMGLDVNIFYILFAFAATLATYNLDRLVILKEMEEYPGVRHAWILRNKNLLKIITVLSSIYLVVSSFFLPWRVIFYLSHLGIISIMYSIPVFNKNGKKIPLRGIGIIKIFLIAYVWMSATVWLPAVEKGLAVFDPAVLEMALRRGLFIFALTLPFDIRDLKSDEQADVITIPGLIGVAYTRILAFVCILLFVVLSAIDHSLESPEFLALLLSMLITLPFVVLAKPSHKEFYFTGIIDGLIIVQFLLVILFCT